MLGFKVNNPVRPAYRLTLVRRKLGINGKKSNEKPGVTKLCYATYLLLGKQINDRIHLHNNGRNQDFSNPKLKHFITLSPIFFTYLCKGT